MSTKQLINSIYRASEGDGRRLVGVQGEEVDHLQGLRARQLGLVKPPFLANDEGRGGQREQRLDTHLEWVVKQVRTAGYRKDILLTSHYS